MLMGQDSKMVGIILGNSKVGQNGEQEFLMNNNNNNNKVFQGESRDRLASWSLEKNHQAHY